MRDGLVDADFNDDDLEALAALFASPAAPFVRSLKLVGEPELLETALDHLARRGAPVAGDAGARAARRPIAPTDPGSHDRGARDRGAQPPPARGPRPRLILGALADHPTIARVVADGYDAIGPLVGRGVLPSLFALDLAFHTEMPTELAPTPTELLRLLPVTSLPALAELDLSRNEPCDNSADLAGPRRQGPGVRLRTRRAPIAAQLTRLRLPSLRTAASVATVQATLDRMPRLASLEVARMYAELPVDLRHPTATTTVAPVAPWPAPDAVDAYAAYWFGETRGADRRRAPADGGRVRRECRAPLVTPGWRSGARSAALEHVAETPIAIEMLRLAVEPIAQIDAYVPTLTTRSQRLSPATACPASSSSRSGAPRTVAASHIRHTGATADRARAGVAADRRARARLQTTWTRELRLAVYGDALQAEGDPRGDLIALDLHVEANGPSIELSERRDDLLDRWLGPKRDWPIEHAVRLRQPRSCRLGRRRTSPRSARRVARRCPVGTYVRRRSGSRPAAPSSSPVQWSRSHAPRPWLTHLACACETAAALDRTS